MFKLLTKNCGLFMVLPLAAVLFLTGAGSYREFVRSESYFALGARLMIERGEWLAPHAPDEGVLNKPPLTYWLIGLSYKVFGPSYGASRLPSAIAALGVLALVYWLAVRINGPESGMVVAAILTTSYLFFNFARMAMSDMLLALFVTASIVCFIALVGSKSGQSRPLLVVAAYGSVGLGVLTKGPVALALVLVPILTELLIARLRDDLKLLQPLIGLLVLIVFTAPYFVLLYFQFGVQPLRFFFLGENLQRFTGAIYGWSQRPIWYEFAAFFTDFAPWSILVPVAIWLDWKRRLQPQAPRDANGRTRIQRILYVWLVWTIVLFSLSNFKLDYYVLPASPAAALIVAGIFSARGRRVVLITCFVIAVTMFTCELTLARKFDRFLPMPQLVASVPTGRTWFTSARAKDWANDIAFNLPPPHQVDRTSGSDEARLSQILKNDVNAVALVREHEYVRLAAADPQLRILAAGETYGHGGLTLKILRQPQRENLFVVGHDR